MYRYQISMGNDVLEIYRFRYEPVDSNMYFIPIRETGVVVDPNINDELLNLFKQYKTKKIYIILTHEHFDHTSGTTWLQSKVENILFCQEDCAVSISTKRGNNPMLVAFVLAERDRVDGGHRYQEFKNTCFRYALEANQSFEIEETLVIEGVKFKCIATPGHTSGSACYIIGDRVVFTGDSLIKNTMTITRLPESNKDVFEEKTLPFLRSLDKNIQVFPGHGEPFKLNEAKYL